MFPENALDAAAGAARAQGPDYVASSDFGELRGRPGSRPRILRPAGVAIDRRPARRRADRGRVHRRGNADPRHARRGRAHLRRAVTFRAISKEPDRGTRDHRRGRSSSSSRSSCSSCSCTTFRSVLWIRTIAAGVPLGIISLVRMRLIGIPPGVIVTNYVRARKAGLNLTVDQMQSHFLAGGNVENVTLAMIAAQRAQIPLEWQRAAAIDLAGRNVRRSAADVGQSARSSRRRSSKASRRTAFSSTSRRASPCAATSIATSAARANRRSSRASAKASSSAVGAAIDHKEVLEYPDRISKAVLAKGLDAGTAFEIVSIDIADVDVGKNIGAELADLASRSRSQDRASQGRGAPVRCAGRRTGAEGRDASDARESRRSRGRDPAGDRRSVPERQPRRDGLLPAEEYARPTPRCARRSADGVEAPDTRHATAAPPPPPTIADAHAQRPDRVDHRHRRRFSSKSLKQQQQQALGKRRRACPRRKRAARRLSRPCRRCGTPRRRCVRRPSRRRPFRWAACRTRCPYNSLPPLDSLAAPAAATRRRRHPLPDALRGAASADRAASSSRMSRDRPPRCGRTGLPGDTLLTARRVRGTAKARGGSNTGGHGTSEPSICRRSPIASVSSDNSIGISRRSKAIVRVVVRARRRPAARLRRSVGRRSSAMPCSAHAAMPRRRRADHARRRRACRARHRVAPRRTRAPRHAASCAARQRDSAQDGRPAHLRRIDRAQHADLRHRPGRHGQDVSRDRDGGARAEEPRRHARDAFAAGRRSRREARLSPRRSREKVDPYLRPLYDALEELLDDAVVGTLSRARHDRSGAARLHARPHAHRRVRHSRRSAERDRAIS